MIHLEFKTNLPQKIAKLRRGQQVLMDETNAAMNRAVNDVLSELKPRVPEGVTGLLRKSFVTSITGTPVNVIGRITSPLDYATPVDLGTKPHFPPSDALISWVERKLGVSDKEARSVAFLVARKISRVGTEGAEFSRDAVAAAKDRVSSDFAAVPSRVARRLESEA